MISLGLFFFQAEDGIRYLVRSRGLGDVYKRQDQQQPLPHEGQPGRVLHPVVVVLERLPGVERRFPRLLGRVAHEQENTPRVASEVLRSDESGRSLSLESGELGSRPVQLSLIHI